MFAKDNKDSTRI